MDDALGDRIKANYEDRTRFFLPRRTYTVIRVDGKAFHTFTRGYKKPFDQDLMSIMDSTAMAMCKELQGVALAYVQSDEISLVLTDFAKLGTNAWFDGNIQKMASVAAAAATANFNKAYMIRHFPAVSLEQIPTAMFDARVFTIPDRQEVLNYLIWRQNDASRNSVQMAARAVYSHSELEGKGVAALHDLLHAKGLNWNDYTTGEKRGRVIRKIYYPTKIRNSESSVMRSMWISMDGSEKEKEIPVFTQDREFLEKLIPQIGVEG